MQYGDIRTAHTGIYLWISGFSNRKQEKQINYIPKKLDLNQKSNFVRDIILAFCKNQGLLKEITKNTNKKYYFNEIKYCKLVQERFADFIVFVRQNYEPQN